ncbi:XRE family transcriptional regulator [Streptomyces sp. NPDC096033]|uniref:XRE family transcriptional regulator n=1 Tax=Streptomyces sp. NPDC096033 TaxID=3366071 RepID=UPI00380979D9
MGISDADRAAAALRALVEADDRQGGHAALEKDALTGRDRVLSLQSRNASERVHRVLFALAAEYAAIAAWSCVDMRQLGQAQTYLNESTTYAGLSQDASTLMRAWVTQSLLATQRRAWTEALAAAQVAHASAAARRDPFFASLGRVRVALAHSSLGDGRSALRSFGIAQDMLAKSTDLKRPRWAAFYGSAELDHLGAIIHNRSRHYARVEAFAHRSVARTPPVFRRNRALATAQLAVAQLGQGEIDQATATAAGVFTIMGGDPLPERMRTLIGDFHRDLITLAPSTTYARDWADRMRT